MIYRSVLGIAACLAVAATFAVIAPPVALAAVGLGVLGLIAAPFALGLVGRFAPEPLLWLQDHPRSIFETRRAGLA